MRRLVACAAVIFSAGCLSGGALTSKAEPLEVRYFSPEGVTPHVTAAATTRTAATKLRLGRVTASAHLRYHIVHRESAVEVQPYDTLRWTEMPVDYTRRSLARALFDDGPFERIVAGAGLTLDVMLIAFEESRRDKQPTGRVQLEYVLHDERTVLASDIITVERDASGPAVEAVVVAIGAAMEGASAELARAVATRARVPSAP